MTRAEELRQIAEERLRSSGSITDTGAIETPPQSFLEKAGNLAKRGADAALYYGSDIAQSALSSPRRGLESIPATGGDVYGLLNSIYSTIGGATAPEQQKIYDEIEKERLLPNSAEVEALSGPNYQPKTGVGQFISDLGATVTGGGGRHFFTENVVPTVGGEAGGEVGEVVGGETGRAVGTVGGGAVNAGLEPIRRGLTAGTPAERQRLIRTLQDEGIELTGGQATGSDRMQQWEVGPYANRPKSVADQQSRQFTAAALRRAGIPGELADDITMTRAQDDFSRQYEAMIAANNGIVMDPQLMQELETHGVRYEDLKGDSRGAVGKIFNRIVDASSQHGGVIPPAVFQQINGEIAATLKAARNSPELAAMSDTLREFRDSLYASMERGGQVSGVADTARQLNRQYRNFKIIEKAMTKGSVEAAYGRLSPAALGEAVRAAESNATFTQNRGDFDELVKAGTLLNVLPNSTSAGRILPYAVGSGLAAGLTEAGRQLASGNTTSGLLTAGGTIAGATLPFVPGAVLNARPVQTSIVNRAAARPTTGVNAGLDVVQGNSSRPDYFAPMTLAPLLHEGMDQPVPVEPLSPDERDEQQSMLENDYPVPVELTDPADILRRRGLRYG